MKGVMGETLHGCVLSEEGECAVEGEEESCT